MNQTKFGHLKLMTVAAFSMSLFSCEGNLQDSFKFDDKNLWGASGVDSSTKNYNSDINDFNFFSNENEIKMETESGVRYVTIKINGMSLRFIFDTGASTISISPAEVAVLIRQGTLKKEDILNVEYFQDATGKISVGTKIILREVQIGSKTLNDVEATVVNNLNAPLLMGQSVLERFGRITIDNENNKIIFN